MAKYLIPIVFILAAAGAVVHAQAGSACDPELVDPSPSPTAYQDRGTRCEGLYAQMVSRVSLEVRSFVEVFETFDPEVTPELVVRWTPPANAEGRQVRLRVFSVKPRTFYRMDAAVPASQGSYRWPSDVLASLGLSREDLGIVGWLSPVPADSPQEAIYLPLRISPDGSPEAAAYRVALMSSRRLESVHVTLQKLGGSAPRTLRDAQELGYGYYPSNVPTVFAVDGFEGEGLYRIRIAGRARNGSTDTEELIFYHFPS